MHSNYKYYVLTVALVIGILGRFIPHPLAVSPMLGLSLFIGAIYPLSRSIFTIGLLNLAIEGLLSWMYDWPLFGSWSIFTTSGYMGSVLFSRFKIGQYTKWKFWLLITFFASIGFWVWTNLGVWLFSGMYKINLAGGLNCYFLALPFLMKSIIGDLIWSSLFMCLYSIVNARQGLYHQIKGISLNFR